MVLKNPAAVALGRLGGKASLTKMSKEARIARAKKASLAAAEARKKISPTPENNPLQGEEPTVR